MLWLRYDTGFALQRRIFSVLRVGDEHIFNCRVAQICTPFSGRKVLPGTAKALDVDKADTDMLGGWAAEAGLNVILRRSESRSSGRA